jgi:hypothetical protein
MPMTAPALHPAGLRGVNFAPFRGHRTLNERSSSNERSSLRGASVGEGGEASRRLCNSRG